MEVKQMIEDNDSINKDDKNIRPEMKHLTIEPLHNNIEVEAMNDEEIASRHLADGPVQNVSSDVEQDKDPVSPSHGFLAAKRTNPPSISQRSRVVIMWLIGVLLLMLTIGYFISYL